jgi:hypothetical protein
VVLTYVALKEGRKRGSDAAILWRNNEGARNGRNTIGRMGSCVGWTYVNNLWTSLLDDDENEGCVVPIFPLAYEHDPDPEMRSYDKPVSSELREKLIIGAAAAIMRIYRYFQERRFAATYATGNSTTYQSRGVMKRKHITMEQHVAMIRRVVRAGSIHLP